VPDLLSIVFEPRVSRPKKNQNKTIICHCPSRKTKRLTERPSPIAKARTATLSVLGAKIQDISCVCLASRSESEPVATIELYDRVVQSLSLAVREIAAAVAEVSW